MALDPKKHPIQYRDHGASAGQHPAVILLHGNFGLGGEIEARMLAFAEEIRDAGYLVAVPRYYPDDKPHGDGDPRPYVPIFADAVTEVRARPDVAPGKIGVVGYSLGAGVALLWMAGAGTGETGVFVDFFGFVPPGLPALGLPPTAFFHNRADDMVPFEMSTNLAGMIDAGVPYLLDACVEQGATPGNHVFAKDGAADTDSRARAIGWLTRHLPPG